MLWIQGPPMVILYRKGVFMTENCVCKVIGPTSIGRITLPNGS